MTTMKRVPLALLAGAAAVLVLASCNAVENKTRSASLLTVETILGKDFAGKQANYLESDVQFSSGSVAADAAIATLATTTLDPDPVMGVSQYEDVVIERIIVTYSRTDGRNVEGVDVPYPFESSLSVLVPVGQSASFSFLVVRAAAKLEPPLVDLVPVTQEKVLQVTAKIQFCGRDLANHAVEAVGYLPIFFANYADKN